MNVTNSSVSGAVDSNYQYYKDGFYILGVDSNGTCLDKPAAGETPAINSYLDRPMKFPEDTLYGCSLKLNFTSFYNFCNDKKWKDLLLFNLENDLTHLGKYGSSELGYSSVYK